jgi:hypothetical protein
MGVVVASAWILVMVKLGEAPTHTLPKEKNRAAIAPKSQTFTCKRTVWNCHRSQLGTLLESLKSCEALPRILEQASALRRRRHRGYHLMKYFFCAPLHRCTLVARQGPAASVQFCGQVFAHHHLRFLCLRHGGCCAHASDMAVWLLCSPAYRTFFNIHFLQ